MEDVASLHARLDFDLLLVALLRFRLAVAFNFCPREENCLGRAEEKLFKCALAAHMEIRRVCAFASHNRVFVQVGLDPLQHLNLISLAV